MKICIIGDGLVSLTLANMLLRKGLTVDIISSSKKKIHMTIQELLAYLNQTSNTLIKK